MNIDSAGTAGGSRQMVIVERFRKALADRHEEQEEHRRCLLQAYATILSRANEPLGRDVEDLLAIADHLELSPADVERDAMAAVEAAGLRKLLVSDEELERLNAESARLYQVVQDDAREHHLSEWRNSRHYAAMQEACAKSGPPTRAKARIEELRRNRPRAFSIDA